MHRHSSPSCIKRTKIPLILLKFPPFDISTKLLLKLYTKTYQCQLLTLVASGLSSTIHRGSPSPHLAIFPKTKFSPNKFKRKKNPILSFPCNEKTYPDLKNKFQSSLSDTMNKQFSLQVQCITS